MRFLATSTNITKGWTGVSTLTPLAHVSALERTMSGFCAAVSIFIYPHLSDPNRIKREAQQAERNTINVGIGCSISLKPQNRKSLIFYLFLFPHWDGGRGDSVHQL